jgi:hypothetical protein
LLEIKTQGGKWKNLIDKTDEWVAMGERENGQRKFCNTETNYEHSKGRYGR